MAMTTQPGTVGSEQTAASVVGSNATHHQIVIVGGGSAGISVAAGLIAQNRTLDIVVIDPSSQHYYQPAWTLVGGGAYRLEDTVKPERDCIPPGVNWIQDAVVELDPDQNRVVTKSGQSVHYDYLVLCPGIQINWHLIQGLEAAIAKGGVCSNYAYQYAPYTWETIRNFKGGNAIFTMPGTPIKCAGAPQKIMYLADETFRKNGVRNQSKVMFCSAVGAIFSVKEYGDTLWEVIKRKEIEVNFKHNLKEIKADSKEAVFDVTTEAGVEERVIPYDMIHVVPPMSAPEFIKTSQLAVADGPMKGWVDVNKETMQHNRYPNVFSLGDASSLPTSKTAAAIRKQFPLLVKNLLDYIASAGLTGKYDGYTCCPLITGYGKTIMAEFDYTLKPLSSFPIDPNKERYSMWVMKTKVIPWLYWNRLLKGQPF